LLSDHLLTDDKQENELSNDIFINQAKYTKELIKKFDLEFVSLCPTLVSMTTKLDKDKYGKLVDIKK